MSVDKDRALTSEMVRAARALLRWEQKDLAERTGLALGSIKRLEGGFGLLAAQARTVAAIEKAFEDAGVTFTRKVDLEAHTTTLAVSHAFKFKLYEALEQYGYAADELPDEVWRPVREFKETVTRGPPVDQDD